MVSGRKGSSVVSWVEGGVLWLATERWCVTDVMWCSWGESCLVPCQRIDL